jgi:hypothetical protein
MAKRISCLFLCQHYSNGTLLQTASIALDNREERLEKVAEAIEVDLQLIGASAIEDKLQDVSAYILIMNVCVVTCRVCRKRSPPYYSPAFVSGC